MTTSRSVAVLLAACVVAGVVRADGPSTSPAAKVDNPLYAAWASQKVGSSATWTADAKGPDGKALHLTATMTLKAITADGVTVESLVTVERKAMPPSPSTIPAKVDPADVKRTGTEDVAAAGRTFKCEVFDMARRAMASAGDERMSVYVSPDVPGGIVKVTAITPQMFGGTLLLTGMESK